MSKDDFVPSRGTDQGTALPAYEWGALAASETFVRGEPVSINAAGSITESATNPDADDFVGFAAGSGDTVGATDPIGTVRTPEGLFTPGLSPNLPTTGDDVPFFRARQQRKWMTRNFSTAGVGVLVTPTVAVIGDVGGLRLNGGVWFFDTAAGTTKLGRVTDVFDANFRSLKRAGAGTGVWVEIEWATSQLSVVSAPLA